MIVFFKKGIDMNLIKRVFLLILILTVPCITHAIDCDFLITQTNIDGGLTIDQAGVWCFFETTTFVEDTGITITTTGVTLDLQGFSFEGTQVGTRAISIEQVAEVTIQNGAIKDILGNGIEVAGTTEVIIDNITMHNVGGDGIHIANAYLVDAMNCTIELTDGVGVNLASDTHDIALSHCTTTSATNTGFLLEGTDCLVHLCISQRTRGTGTGYVLAGSSITTSFSNARYNINGYQVSGDNNVIKQSYIGNNSADGILVLAGATDNIFLGNRLQWNAGYGIRGTGGTLNTAQSNSAEQNGLGNFYRIINLQ